MEWALEPEIWPNFDSVQWHKQWINIHNFIRPGIGNSAVRFRGLCRVRVRIETPRWFHYAREFSRAYDFKTSELYSAARALNPLAADA
jgi:hypothetical protein